MIKRISVAAALLGVFTAAPAAASAQGLPIGFQKVTLDSRAGTAVSTKKRLAAGVPYVVIVRGNYSVYGQSLWNRPAGSQFTTCGTTQAVTYPSPGQRAGVGGRDAEVLFAGIAHYGCGDFQPPYAGGKFKVSTDVGVTFANLDPLAGAPSAPDALNTYVYGVQGAGKKAAFAIDDDSYVDNNGLLKITVGVASPLWCAGNGWKAFDAFESGPDCVASMTPAAPQPR